MEHMNTQRSPERRRSIRSGSVLVEFAFIALAFYLLFAGTIELGRMITTSQAVQNAARVGAREMALVALPPTATFREALADPQVRARIYDPALLAIQTNSLPDTSQWPIVNRMLTPLMIMDRVGNLDFYHYPGTVIRDTSGNYTVRVAKVLSDSGGERIEWVDVVEEVRPDPSEGSGPFSLASTGPERGLVALRINCPYQATTMTSYRMVNGVTSATSIQADDLHVDQSNDVAGTFIGAPVDYTPEHPGGAYAGMLGLGQFRVMGQDVRPFRSLISAQSIFRREVYR
jgi:hypothetical protein